jgi:hypothetical protein
MVEKVKITEAVKEVLSRNPSWAPALANELISPSKVARKIVDEVAKLTGASKKEIKLDSVVKAVKIYMANLKTRDVSDLETSKRILGDSKLTMMANMAIMTVKIGPDIGKKITKVLEIIYGGDQRIYLSQGRFYLSMIFSRENLDKIRSIFDKKQIVYEESDRTGILIETPGLADYDTVDYDAYILNLLAGHGIHIIHYSCAWTDSLVLVPDDEAITAFQALKSEMERLKNK